MPATAAVRAVRGATTLDEDSSEQIEERVQEMLLAIMDRNDLEEEDVISIIFTATNDVTAKFPATAARTIGFGSVPLLCATEIAVRGATPRCIRVLLHVTTMRQRDELRHVYLRGAQGLRDDLPS